MSVNDFDSRLPVRTEQNGDVVAFLADGTTPTQLLGIDSSGRITIKLQDGAGNAITSQVNGVQRALDVGINVSGVQIDPRQIRALTAADVVTANQGAPNTNSNGWFVKITDGSNNATVLATGELKVAVTQPIAAGTNLIGSVNSRTQDGAGVAITSTLINSKQRLDVNLDSSGTSGSAVPFGTQQIGGTDGTNLRALSTDTNGKLKIDLFDASGNAFSSSNPLPVLLSSSTPGTDVTFYYASASNLAAGASDSLGVYTITATKTLSIKKIWASASGKIRMDFQTSPDGVTWTTVLTSFNSTADTNISFDTDELDIKDSGSGSAVRFVITNRDKQPFQVFGSMLAKEN